MRNINSVAGFSTSATGTDFSNTSGDVSQANLYSQPFRMSDMEGCSFQFAWTGTTTGTIALQVSNDDPVNVPTPYTPATWTTLTTPTALAPAGSAANGYLTLPSCYSAWVRAVYTKTSGTGVLTGRFDGKGPE